MKLIVYLVLDEEPHEAVGMWGNWRRRCKESQFLPPNRLGKNRES